MDDFPYIPLISILFPDFYYFERDLPCERVELRCCNYESARASRTSWHTCSKGVSSWAWNGLQSQMSFNKS